MKKMVKVLKLLAATALAGVLMMGGHQAMAQSDPKAQKDSDKLDNKRQEVKSDDKAIVKDVTHGNMKKAKGDYNEMRADKKEMKAAKKQTKIDKKETKAEEIKDKSNP